MGVRGNSLRGGGMRGGRLGGDGDPMDSMGNLMDVMLVFACGLMIALVARYNVDLSASQDISGDVQRIDDELEQVDEGISDDDSKYAELGTVYRDTETGELYVVAAEEADVSGLDLED